MDLEQSRDQFDRVDQFALEAELVEARHAPVQQSTTLPDFRPQEITVASDLASKQGIKVCPISTDPGYYEDPKDFRRELKRAQTICLDLSSLANELINDVRMGLSPDVSKVRELIVKIVQSVIRHPDALVWVARLHSNDAYSFSHAVRCAIFSVVFGRRLGLKEPKLETLALAALLCQIGKAKLPKQLLEQRDALTPEELVRIREHVEVGVELLKAGGEVSDEVVEIVQNHCERFDGSGYPHGKRGDEIPLLARIVGLVDCYDAMTSIKPHTDDILSSCDDLDYLYEQRDLLFQGQLVEEFIQALGIYPTGTLVELNSGHVALIQSQNEANRLQPEMLLVLDKDKQALNKFKKINLRQYNETHDHVLSIKRALSAGEFGLDPNKLMRHYAGQKRGWAKFAFGH